MITPGLKRPVLFVLLFLVTGILAGTYADMRMAFFYMAGMGIVCICLYKFYRYVPVFVFLFFSLAGLWRVSHSLREPALSPSPVAFTGTVWETGTTASGNQRITVHNGQMRVTAYLKPGMAAVTGQSVTLHGILRPLSTPQYPGAYNEFQTLRSRKIDAKIFPDAIDAGEVRLTGRVLLNRISSVLAGVYNAVLPPREAAVIRSVTLGEKGGLDDDIAYLYRMAGIYHILSISGLHIAILMLAVKSGLGLYMQERRAGVTALIIMIFYCLLTGAAVSTVRAVTMCGLAVFGKVWFREYDLLASTAFACIALLLYEPLYLYSVGFQLSFSAVFGIAILSAPIEHALTLIRFPFIKIKNALAIGSATVAATYPVLSFHFYEISAYSILANLIIVPTAVVLVVVGAAVGLVGLIWLPAAVFLSGILFYLLPFYEIVCTFFASLPFSVIKTGSCGLVVAAAAYAVMLLFAYTFSGSGRIRLRLAGLGTGVMVLVVCIFLRAYPAGLEIMALEETAVLRHGRDAWIIGERDTAALARYREYANIQEAGYMESGSVIPFGETRIGFAADEPADVMITPGQGNIIYDLAPVWVVNGGNPWARSALSEGFAARNIIAFDTSKDGAVRLRSDGKKVKIFANYR